MPDIAVGNQVFDVVFHPNEDIVLAGLLTGEIKAFSYNDDGEHEAKWDLRPTKRSCRGLAFSYDGDRVYSVSKDRTLHVIDSAQGSILETKLAAHDSPINRVAMAMPHMLATGDDEGVIKLWDTRNMSEVRAYKQHFDFISDFLWLEDKKHLVATSGDGTLSVMDVRASKTEPFAHSEDQEDELLSIVPIKGDQKVVVGTQLGVISIFNRKSGWGDCVDRFPGHPQSIDALAALTQDVILTGSSDGLVRAVQILPSKFLGAVADHGEFPVERLALDRRKKWLASASHDELLKLTDVQDALEESDDEGEKDAESRDDDEDQEDDEADTTAAPVPAPAPPQEDSDADSDEPAEKRKKRKKKSKDKDGSRKKANTAVDGAFFDEL
ncbi:WD40 repeat-like protein [Exidia glandulosa HHB12029]|uniref:WD repeat-containing protein JIP5 n=1 Tax=Exidia glandulosa HHB12029 TaxID=1314781 RepID=A0A165H2Q6_EXIGL|nr:WD40 repeat-like protein [Exidia glandulosa HHB12029]